MSVTDPNECARIKQALAAVSESDARINQYTPAERAELEREARKIMHGAAHEPAEARPLRPGELVHTDITTSFMRQAELERLARAIGDHVEATKASVRPTPEGAEFTGDWTVRNGPDGRACATPTPAATSMNKPITRAFITVHGDKSVGIPDAQFTAELYVDPSCYAPEDWNQIVRLTRNTLQKAYADIHGEPATVRFDTES